MIEQLLSIGGSIASIYSAISAVGTGAFQKRVVVLLEQQNQELIRIADGILYSPQSHSVRVQFEEKVITEIGRKEF